MTGTDTLEREDTDTRTKPKPPIAHIYCGRCFENVRPQIAFCGRPRPSSSTGRIRDPAPADVCVVCTEMRDSGNHKCRTCGRRIRP